MLGYRNILLALLMFAGLGFPAGSASPSGAVAAAGERADVTASRPKAAQLDATASRVTLEAEPSSPASEESAAEQEEHPSSLAAPSAEITHSTSSRLPIGKPVADPSRPIASIGLPRGPPTRG